MFSLWTGAPGEETGGAGGSADAGFFRHSSNPYRQKMVVSVNSPAVRAVSPNSFVSILAQAPKMTIAAPSEKAVLVNQMV
jgi:hypothetical protein